MAKTLIVAEKPSVARDLAGALPGSFTQSKDKTSLEGEDHVVSWAVGHLVGLAEPDAYDPKLKKWRYADLPIVPDEFKLVPNDDRAKKQLNAIHKLMAREDIDEVINACDAGREGELIFAYVYETSKKKPPVKRLWLSSMTKKAIADAFETLRDGEEMHSLEDAARSRSEADWVVGMNATRAASIRLRAAFDGAVSLGRVQTPTLALVARREVEIRAFVPEPYWLVEAKFGASGDRSSAEAAGSAGGAPRVYSGRYMGGKRIAEDEAATIVKEVEGQSGVITKLEKKEETEKSQILYDLTSLQRHANTLLGFSARRTLSAAQKLYEEHKALTYPRTNSRFLTGDMAGEIKPIAKLVGANGQYKKASEYVVGLDKLPYNKVINDAKVQDHHAIIPTNADNPHDLSKMGSDELKIYDLVTKRFLSVFHPDATFERTRVETTVAEHVFRTSGRVLTFAGWRSVYGEEVDPQGDTADDSGGNQNLPKLEQGEDVDTREVESLRKETQPPRRFTEASLLAAMEGAGKEIEDAELRDAMAESGIGTPATRASIIETLIGREFMERDGRALVATEKGVQVIGLLGEHPLTSAKLTGEWEKRLNNIEHGEDSRPAFMKDIKAFITDTVAELDKLKGVQIERAKLGPCPVCAREVHENRKGYSCWTKEDPGCGFVIWKKKASKNLPVAVAKELMASLKAALERGDEPPIGRTEKQVTGFRGRSGRSFRAKLRIEPRGEEHPGRWKVEFDEEWADRPRAEPSEEQAEASTADGKPTDAVSDKQTAAAS